MVIPHVIILISGKRKSGKDFVADRIVGTIGKDDCIIIRLSAPIKKHFCEKYGLDFHEMLTASEYKEKIRREMILWGEEERNKDDGVFCRSIIEDALLLKKRVWVLSDARRISDVKYFEQYASEKNIKLHCIRVMADDNTRVQRNWKFTTGVDDAESECGLDSYNKWDFLFNNSTGDDVGSDIKKLCKLCQS